MELHFLTCKRDFQDFLLSVRTFLVCNKVDWNLVIHSDGTLDTDEISIIQDSFENVRIVTLEEANDTVLKSLEEYRYCYKFRKNYMGTHSKQTFLKIFDPFFFCLEDYYITMDSDIFTYERCDRLLKLAEDKTPFYHGGGWGYFKYPVSIKKLKNLGFNPVGNINTGLIGIGKNLFNLGACDRFFKMVEDNPGEVSLTGQVYTGEEEPLFSCLMGDCKEHKVLWAGPHESFTPEYAKYMQEENYYGINLHPNLCVMCHYVGAQFIELGRKYARNLLDKHGYVAHR